MSFLLFEPAFPRSLRYCLRSAHGLLERIWGSSRPGAHKRPSIARLDHLLEWLDEEASRLDVKEIHKLLTTVVDETIAICSHVSREIQGPAHAGMAAMAAERPE